MNTIVKDIRVSTIRTNPNNPRKAFNEQSLQELAISIQTQGVLQPIIVKNTNDPHSEYTYEIICGERRFRASQIAGLETIPAVVQAELSEDKYYEIALTENLQREDVSPLEEMQIYQHLMEQRDYTADKLAEKFGKNESYIRSRMRLSELIEEYYPILQSEDISLAVALELSKYSKEVQAEVYDDHFATDNNYQNWLSKSAKEIVSLLEHNYSTDLEDYFFDKLECYNCNYNTQIISLFTDDTICGRCTNRSCLKAKNTAYIVERAIATHEQNPELPLARYDYRYDETAIEELSTKGYDIKIVDWCRESPTPPVVDDYENDEEYQADLAEFIEETTELTEKYQQGKISMYALIGTRGVTLSYRDMQSNGGSTSTTAETPLVKLQNQDIRNKEISIEKTIADTKDLVNGLDVANGDFSAFEEQITYFSMAKALRRENFEKVGFEDKHYLTDEDRWTLAYNLTEEKKTIIKRDFILSNLKDAERGNYTAVMLFGYAEQHAEEQLNEIKTTHNDVYEKRHERILEKITAIETAE